MTELRSLCHAQLRSLYKDSGGLVQRSTCLKATQDKPLKSPCLLNLPPVNLGMTCLFLQCFPAFLYWGQFQISPEKFPQEVLNQETLKILGLLIQNSLNIFNYNLCSLKKKHINYSNRFRRAFDDFVFFHEGCEFYCTICVCALCKGILYFPDAHKIMIIIISMGSCEY